MLKRNAHRFAGMVIGTVAVIFMAPPAAGAAEIINASRNAMVVVQITPSGLTTWESDLAKGQPVQPNSYINLYVSGNQGCYYDARVKFGDGRWKIYRRIYLCGPGAAPRLNE
jgi:hypothetical protein